ncbi:hypothetical protein DOZ80_18555 [Pseudomonas fluorescens]|uniref:Uncharacterized protein n=1 Tax=Pseudomonas fluorescens TaxID=294 RepID=A0A327MX37_PSEFL|nr:hypothetical protein DOZ80_18555 [Pseudomonas fluorescens]
MRRKSRNTCIASRSVKARGCRRRFWGWRRKCLLPEFCGACTGLIAGKPAPTDIALSLWERACPRWRQFRQHKIQTKILEYHYRQFLPYCHMTDSLQP